MSSRSAVVRFSVLALLVVGMVGGASAVQYGTTATADDADNSDESQTREEGIVIQPNTNLAGVELQYYSGVNIYDATTLEVKSTGGTVLWSKDVDNQDNVQVDYSFSSGTKYYVYLVNRHYNRLDSNANDPYTSADIDIESGYLTGSAEPGFIWNFKSVTAILSFNEAPQFNSSSVEPDPPLIGENVSYSAEVSDSDGSIDYTNLDVEWKGSQVYNANRTGTTTPSWDDVYTPGGTGWLNATLRVVDDSGAVTEKEINRYLSDTSPSVSLSDPGNRSYFKYDAPLSFSVSDSDSNPEEDWSCDVDRDGALYQEVYLKEGTNSSYSDVISSDLGSHSVNVSCSDNSGNNDSASENYEVKSFEIQNIRADSPVYETLKETFESDFKAGSMVNNVTAFLYYDGTFESSENKDIGNSITTTFSDQDFEIPLVSSNKTSKNWSYEFQVNYDKFQSSSTGSKNFTSSDQSQEIYWSYWIKDSYPENADIIEGEDVVHQVEVGNKSSKATLDGSLNFTRTTGTVNSERQKENSTDTYIFFEGSEHSDKLSQNSRTDTLNTSIDISFNGYNREIFSTDSVTTHKIRMDKCQSLSTKALEFTIYNERDRDQKLNTTMNLAWELWKDPSVKRTYNTSSEQKKTHSFCIAPSWATYTVDSSEKLIQFQDVNENYRLRSHFFLERKISNNTDQIDLYDVKSAESSRIEFKTVDQNGEALPEIIIRAERYFPAVDKQITVAMLRTGANGRSETFLEVNEIYYSFKFYRKNDQGKYILVKETPLQTVSQDTLVFTLGDAKRISYYEFKQGINYNCAYNGTQVECSYSTEEAVDHLNLEVKEQRAIQYESVCDKKSSTASGKLICKGLNATDKDFRYSFKAITEDGNTVTLETGTSGNKGLSFGDTGVIMSFFFFVTLGLAGLSGPRPIPEIAVALSTLSIVISYSLGLLGITYQAAATFVILGAVTIYKMRNSSYGGL